MRSISGEALPRPGGRGVEANSRRRSSLADKDFDESSVMAVAGMGTGLAMRAELRERSGCGQGGSGVARQADGINPIGVTLLTVRMELRTRPESVKLFTSRVRASRVAPNARAKPGSRPINRANTRLRRVLCRVDFPDSRRGRVAPTVTNGSDRRNPRGIGLGFLQWRPPGVVG